MMRLNKAPVSPVLAGALLIQMSGVLPCRISAKLAFGVLTLIGANSVMSSGPDHSSRCFISSQLFGAPPYFVFTSTHDPLSL